MKPKAILVPFGYSDYPQELVEKFITKIKNNIGELNGKISN